MPVRKNLYRYKAECHQHIGEMKQSYFLLSWPGFMTFAIGDMKRTKRRGPRTEP